MPVLFDQRRERFAQLLAEGKSTHDAYIAAGYKPNRGNATRLKANEVIRKRVQELQNEAAMEAKITKADVLRMLQEDRNDARANGQYSPAIRAAELIGKELGMFVDRSENVNMNYVIGATPAGEEENADSTDLDAWITKYGPN